MTGAERSWASHYEIDDVVRYTRGSKAIGIEAAAYASVVAINPAANQLTVEKANQELATYDPRRLTGVSVYREIEREFSVGDRIQFTAPDKSLGVANRDLAVIEAIHPDGRLSARLDNNRQIEFNASEHRHFDHGYAVTSHSSQGLTAERVLVHADTSVHPDLLNSRFGYVSISRASHEATLFTDDMAKLGPQLGADVSKTSALEINQASSVARELGTTQLYNKRVVYNQKRHGTFPLGNRMVTFERRMNVPRQLSPEFLLVDLVNELGDLAEDRDAVLSRVREKAKEMDPKKLSRAVSLYGKYSTQKKFQEMLQHA
jgi:hypothetical protein